MIPRASVMFGQMASRWGRQGCRRSQVPVASKTGSRLVPTPRPRGRTQELGQRLAVEAGQHERATDVEPAGTARLERALDIVRGQRRARTGVVQEGALAVARVEDHRGAGQLVAHPQPGGVEPARGGLAGEHAAEQVVSDAPAQGGGNAESRERGGRRQGAAPGVELDRVHQREAPRLGHLVHGRSDRVGHHDARAQHLGSRVRRHCDGDPTRRVRAASAQPSSFRSSS